MYKVGYLVILSLLLFSACQNVPTKDNQAQSKQSKSIFPEVAVIKEAFTTLHDESDNVDSPALWHGDNGQNWLLATAKEGNAIIVYDAATGEKIIRFGQAVCALGDFKYGALYPVHNDGSLAAISWEDIAKTLNLGNNCN